MFLHRWENFGRPNRRSTRWRSSICDALMLIADMLEVQNSKQLLE
jgi:hypothetical protein